MSARIGIDIGETRLRMTLCDGKLVAVATRDLPQGAASSAAIADPALVGAIVEEAHEELRTRERRCVLSVGLPAASVRAVRFPRMAAAERRRAARFEAQRFVHGAADDAMLVRLHAAGGAPGCFALGVASAEAVRSRLKAVDRAGLSAVAVDYDAFAFKRALPDYDAILDIGHRTTRLHVLGATVPKSFLRKMGGLDVTLGIQHDLQLDRPAAEKRKRIVGTQGAGENARLSLLKSVASLLQEAADNETQVARMAIVGNGGLLAQFASDVQRVTGIEASFAVSALYDGYARADVAASAAPDWTLATGLSA